MRGVTIFLYLCRMDKQEILVKQAKEFFDYFCDNVIPAFRELGDLDPTEDYEEVMEELPTEAEREWFHLWSLFYDELECYITHYEE